MHSVLQNSHCTYLCLGPWPQKHEEENLFSSSTWTHLFLVRAPHLLAMPPLPLAYDPLPLSAEVCAPLASSTVSVPVNEPADAG